jgi:hypothetical protein
MEHRLTATDQLVFVHIPKTAGLTFRALLANHFDVRETYPRPDEWWWVARDTDANLARYRLFNGHYVYSAGERLRKPVHVTMLRHPLDRLISTYHYLRQNPNSFQYDYVSGRKLTLEEFLEDPVTARAQRDWQSGFVGSVPLAELMGHQARMTDLAAWTGAETRSFYPSLGSGVAIERLESFAMFGLCERFQDAVYMLHYVFGWKPAKEYQSFNIAGRGSRRAELSPALIDGVLERNAEDVALYARATTLFDERFRTMCETLLERYGDARHARATLPLSADVIVELLERHYEARYSEANPEPRSSFVWDVAAPVEGTGWHAAEPVAAKRFGRWTGPGRSTTLDVRLAAGTAYAVEFTILASAAPDLIRNIELRANGVTIELKRKRRLFRSGRRFYGTIPASTVGERPGNLVTLEWTVRRTVDARELGRPGEDVRRLGLMFARVSIVPSGPLVASAATRGSL